MFPAFVPTQDFDFHPQKINRNFQIRVGQTRHAHRVFFGRDNHRQVAADTTVNEADQFRFGVIMMIDVAFREIDVRAEFGKRALKTFRGSDPAKRTDERVAQSLERQLFASENILQIKRFVRALDNFRGAIVTPDPFASTRN